MATAEESGVTLLSKRVRHGTEEAHSSQDTAALLAEDVFSDSETGETGEYRPLTTRHLH